MADWKYTTGKVRGAYGITDLQNRTVKVDKARHKRKGTKRITPNKDGTENLYTTIAHELLHRAHPDWSEKKVEAFARKKNKTASSKEKQRAYSKFN